MNTQLTWISPKVELPDTGRKVLIAKDTEQVTVARRRHAHFVCVSGMAVLISRVDFWMDILPHPYKKKSRIGKMLARREQSKLTLQHDTSPA